MARERRPVPEPVQTNDVLIAAVGAVGFAVAFAVLMIVPLAPHDRWWRWVCVAGFAMGLFGCWYAPRLQRQRERAAARRRSAGREPDGEGLDAARHHGAG